MSASQLDLFRKTARRWVSQIGAGGVTDAVVTTIPLSSTTNLPTDTGVTVTIDRVDANGATTASKEETITGVVSGNNLVSCTRGVEGTAQAHDAGAVVELLFSNKIWNDFIDALLVGHNQDGTLKGNNITLTTPTIPSFYQDAGRTKLMTTPNTASDTLAAIAATQTFTNKRITSRVVTATDDATAVIDCAVTDQYELSAVANATEFTVTGTPTNGQKLLIRFKDAGVGKGLTFTGFTAIGCTLPTTTVAGKWGYVFAVYNLAATVWHVLAVGVEA